VRRLILALIPANVLMAAVTFAQNSDFNLSVHANSHATAKDIGLPVYPGATPFKNKDSDSSVDLGFALNSVHFNLQVASFVTQDSQDQVFAFYRKALTKYGEVQECNHGKRVGSLAVTKSGLTCGDHKGGRMTANGSDSDYELRAGGRSSSASSGLTVPSRRKQNLDWWRWCFRKKRTGGRQIR
jgi:hypothetical protein